MTLITQPIRNMAKWGAMRILSKEVRQWEDSLNLVQERMADLELYLEDQDWFRLMGEDDSEFSRQGLRNICKLSRLMVIKNPIIQRGVQVKMSYVWGQGISWKASDPDIQEAIKAFMDDDRNQAELTSHQARMLKEKELETEGNLFLVLFTNISTGHVTVRSIPFDEIEDVVSNPGDRKEPWYYLRQWKQIQTNPGTGQQETLIKKAYYPDWRYQPTKRLSSIGGVPIRWNDPVYHVKVGGFSTWKFGLSEVYAAIDWAKAYKEFLEDVATLMRAYSRFAWRMTTTGGKRGIAKAKSILQTTMGASGGTSAETNPAPVVGSTFLSGGGAEMTPYNVRGASVNPEDGRRIFLMATAALGLPETFFGDVKTGNLATAKSLDRPTELMMLDRQTLWKDVHAAIYEYVLRQSIKAPSGILDGKHGKVEQRIDGKQITEMIVWNDNINATIDIDFPPIIQQEIDKVVNALVQAAELIEQAPGEMEALTWLVRKVLVTFGEDDVDELMDELFPEDEPLGDTEPALREAVKKLQALIESKAVKA